MIIFVFTKHEDGIEIMSRNVVSFIQYYSAVITQKSYNIKDSVPYNQN
jgi:hypothetical protein